MGIDISIVVLTYYHEKYIRQSLDSVLAQVTDYSYEIIVSDDASQDRTVEIIKEYAEKYPNIIKPIFHEKNVGIPANGYNTCCMGTGKYLTFLSGDDYWIRNDRLQHQVQFLEEHPEFYGVTGCSETRYDEETKPIGVLPPRKYRDREVTYEEYLKGAPFPLRGMMIRNGFLTNEGKDYYSHIKKASKHIDDATFGVLLLNAGRFFIGSEITDVYRIHRSDEGQHSYNSLYRGIDHIEQAVELYNYVYDNLPFHGDLFDKYVIYLSRGFSLKLDPEAKERFQKVLASVPKEYLERKVIKRARERALKLKLFSAAVTAGKAMRLDKLKHIIVAGKNGRSR